MNKKINLNIICHSKVSTMSKFNSLGDGKEIAQRMLFCGKSYLPNILKPTTVTMAMHDFINYPKPSIHGDFVEVPIPSHFFSFSSFLSSFHFLYVTFSPVSSFLQIYLIDTGISLCYSWNSTFYINVNICNETKLWIPYWWKGKPIVLSLRIMFTTL